MGRGISKRTYNLTRLRGAFAVAIYEGGRRLSRRSLSTDDPKEAEQRLKRFIRDQEQPPEITVAYLWQRYCEENAGKGIVVRMEFSGKALLPEFGHLKPEEVNSQDCRRYATKRRNQGRKTGTVWTELNHLQIVLNWAAGQRIIPHVVKVLRPPKPPPRDRRLSRKEAQSLLDAADTPHAQLAIALMLGTGARIGAVLALTWDRVDFERGLIAYPDPRDDQERRKGRATVPMTDDLRGRLQVGRRFALSEYVIEYAGERVLSIKRSFATAVRAAGLKGVSPHVLRHTAACLMAESGVSMPEIAAVLGHQDSRITERVYAKYSPTYLRGAIAALTMSAVPASSDEPVDAPETRTPRRKRQETER